MSHGWPNLLQHAFLLIILKRYSLSLNLHTLILCSLRTLSLCHSVALVIFPLSFSSTYLCLTLPLAACHYSLFHRLPPLLLHPPAPQSISSPLKPQALLSVVKPPSEPRSEESDRQTERNEPRKDAADSSLRWAEVSLTLCELCVRERRKKAIRNICAAITCGKCASEKRNMSWS